MFKVTGVVKHILIINILMYFGTFLMGEPGGNTFSQLINEVDTNFWNWERYILAIFHPSSEYFKPYQIITHMFMHGSLGHLFFNMFAVFMFAPPLEALWGPKRFLFYYFFTAFGALALHLGVQTYELQYGLVNPLSKNIPMLGASGAVFGVLVGYGMKFPNSVIQLLIPPIPIKAKYFVIIYAALELFFGIRGIGSGIAHFAHVGGALFGFLLILYWRKYGSRL